MDNNNFTTSGAAPAPAITSQSTPAQDGTSPQINPKKPKTSLIIGIAVIIAAIIIGTIIIIPIISSKNTNEGREEGGSGVSSSEDDSNDGNKSQKKDGKLILGINSKTITVTNNLKSIVSEFVKAGYSVTYRGTDYKEKVQLTTNNLEDIFKNTSLTISSLPCFSIKTEKDEYGVYDDYSLFGIMPGHVDDDKNTDISNIPKVALSEFELATLKVNGDNINYSINGKSFNSQNASYDEIKKAFGREADKIDDGYIYYNEDSFEVEIITESEEIIGINIEPIRQ